MSTSFYIELRAQAAIFVLALAALALAALVPSRDSAGLIFLVYINGAMFLGAQSVGHDYTHRTLAMALAQPVFRQRTFFQKMAVLTMLLLVLAAVASIALGSRPRQTPIDFPLSLILGLPLLHAVLMAPLMTMLSRTVLGGAFLSFFVAGSAWMLMLVAIAWTTGAGIDEAGARALRALPVVSIAMCAVTGVLGWRRFLRLEALEGDVAAITMPALSMVSKGRRHHPWRALIGKELHLQQLTLAIALQYFVTWAAIAMVMKAVPSWSKFPLRPVTLVYCMILPAVVGAIASAEERRLGMHDWQRLQPVAARQQWMIKVMVTFAVSLVCGLGLPMLLASFVDDAITVQLAPRLAMICILMTSATLYVSSISPTAVASMVLALPITLAFGLLLQLVATVMAPAAATGPQMVPGWPVFFYSPVPAAIVAVVMLWLAFVNHSSGERPVSRTIAQLTAIAAIASVAMIVV